jgi:PhnB protein
MTGPHPQEPARSVGKVVEIGAPVDAVWAALTTPDGLRNFYCDWAKVTPGVGGSFQIGWDGFGGLPPARIEAWEPGARLRIVYDPPPGETVTTAEEWTLRAEGDHTVVRLVYEGFGEGTDWDAFYDGFDATSALVVDLLAAWLGPAGGAPLAKARVDVPVAGDRATAWRLALGAGLGPGAAPRLDAAAAATAAATAAAGTAAAAGGDPTPQAGTTVAVALPAGAPLAGTVVFVAPGREACVRLDGDAGRFVLVTRPGPNAATTRVLIEHYAWGIDPATRAANQARLDAAADALANRPPGTTAAERAAEPAGTSAVSATTGTTEATHTTEPEETRMTDTSFIPDDSPALVPYLCCDGAAAAIDFYVEVLGATESGSRFTDPEGKVGHAELTLNGSLFYLSDPFPDLGVVAPSGEGNDVGLLAYVPDVDAVVTKATAAGATVLQAPDETFYGTRRATLTDPFGHRWMVGTHIRNVTDDEHQRAVDEFAQR